MKRDRVHEIHQEWAAHAPELDTTAILVIGRLVRAAALVNRAADEQLAEFGLTRPEFEMLSVLRRTGQPRTPGQLTREMLSSGASTTKRLDRLERAGLVRRETGERDRRVAYLTLTDAGRDLIDKVLPAYVAREETELAGLAPGQRDKLGDLLSKLLNTLES